MPFNGSGGFDSVGPPDFPAVAGDDILADQYNDQMNDIFAGFGNCLTRDGQSPATDDLPMGGFLLSGLGAGALAGDSLSWGQTGASLNGLVLTGEGIFKGAVAVGVGVTGLHVGLGAGAPYLKWTNASGGSNSKVWDCFASTTQLSFRVVNDAISAFDTWLAVTRSAASVTSLAFGGTSATFPATLAAAGAISGGSTITAIGGFVGALTGNVTGNLTGNITGNVTGTSGSTTGNAATATKLLTARTINGTSFDGSANITPGVTASAVTTNANFSVPFLSAATGTATVSTDPGLLYNPSTNLLTTSTSGNSATATALATTRAINGVNFNGTAAITTPVNATAVATNASFAVPFLSGATGNVNVQTDAGMTYNPSTDTLTVGAALLANGATALNWYEEGTFTPTVVGATSAGVTTYSSRSGRFTRMGNLVRFFMALNWSAATGTGTMTFGGLPYVVNSGEQNAPCAYAAVNQAKPFGIGLLNASAANISLYNPVTDAAIAITNGGVAVLSGSYSV